MARRYAPGSTAPAGPPGGLEHLAGRIPAGVSAVASVSPRARSACEMWRRVSALRSRDDNDQWVASKCCHQIPAHKLCIGGAACLLARWARVGWRRVSALSSTTVTTDGWLASAATRYPLEAVYGRSCLPPRALGACGMAASLRAEVRVTATTDGWRAGAATRYQLRSCV